jgi:uncharacterized delta-60 repeat protein
MKRRNRYSRHADSSRRERHIAFEGLEGRKLFAAGDLDALFSGDGKVTVDFPGSANPDWGNAMAIQSDGKIIVAGQHRPEYNGSTALVALARFNRDGSLDTSFGGGDGMVVQDVVFASSKDVPNAVAVQSDGRIVVAGYAFSGSESRFMVARFLADGTFDTTFGWGGSNSSLDFNPSGANSDLITGMALTPDNRIVVCGYTGPSQGPANYDFGVARFTANGMIDASFSGDGRTTHDFGNAYDLAGAVARSNNGDYYVTGGSAGNFAIARFNVTGSLVAARTDDLGGDDFSRAIAIDLSHDVLIGGYSRIGGIADSALIRYDSNLTLDSSFGSGGKLRAAMSANDDWISSLAVQPDWKIVAGGVVTANDSTHDFMVTRLTATGAADSGFGPHGMRTTDFGFGSDEVAAVAIDDDGKIVAAGSALIQFDDDFAVTRYEGGQYNYHGEFPNLTWPIQMEDYDMGGEGISYHDQDGTNWGDGYRVGGVDVYNRNGGRAIGFAMPGEWVEYTVNVTEPGAHRFEIMGGTQGNAAKFHIEVDGVNVSGPLTPHDMLSDGSYGITTRSGINLSAGQHVIRVVFDQVSTTWGIVGEFDWLKLVNTDAIPAWFSPAPGAIWSLESFPGFNNLAVHGGQVTFTGDAATTHPNLVVTMNSNTTAIFESSQHLKGISMNSTARAIAAPNGNRVLHVKSLSMAVGAILDLNDNDLLIDYTGTSPLAGIRDRIVTARAGGNWTGAGITSTSARNHPNANTMLGVMEAVDFKSAHGAGATFDGEALDDTAVLVKYTYYGDADFNGSVDGDDYARIDNGYNFALSGWFNGDADLSGAIDADDYALLDNALNTQGAAL